MPTWGMWAILVLLLIVRGLLSAMEAALQTLSDERAKELAAAGTTRAVRLLKLKTDPEATAAAIRLGMVLSGFTAVGTGIFVIPRVLDYSLLEVVASSWMVWLTPLLSALVVALVATLVDITFRSAALQRPESWALNLSRLGIISVTLLWPMVKLLVL